MHRRSNDGTRKSQDEHKNEHVVWRHEPTFVTHRWTPSGLTVNARRQRRTISAARGIPFDSRPSCSNKDTGRLGECHSNVKAILRLFHCQGEFALNK